eukprot:CAMPEP_0167779844 /NCGR_PEP_ID=MMETSP0111_2-20121227/5029_1 /TAXON_ID=91324 /ORGANISM="Lotharella globosa, Strain CCCM811" /LENGTH=57 /DNA_ID=CAMNT_0007670293 /DNA_START=467 /DNA_END=637 /DNA_ORIENTATION=+
MIHVIVDMPLAFVVAIPLVKGVVNTLLLHKHAPANTNARLKVLPPLRDVGHPPLALA